jgi:hypothetical protein
VSLSVFTKMSAQVLTGIRSDVWLDLEGWLRLLAAGSLFYALRQALNLLRLLDYGDR